ncbi:MAG: C39 family peptidase [Patescibacteria group bacterium]|jgi:hypothetical protein|nr:C39 family peptidase [Patescibacteria group bacterium]
MKIKILIILIIFSIPIFLRAETIEQRLSGKILLSVEENGEAWYLNPDDNRRHYLGRPVDAFNIMRELSLGITNDDYNKIVDDVPLRFLGKILLKVEDLGKAYYVNPDDMKMHYLGRPADAFKIMRELGLGISKENLRLLREFNKNEIISKNVQYNVPFTSQAPNAEWYLELFQDGCEEASALIAVSWARDEVFDDQMARKAIVDTSDWEDKRFGEFLDISAEDTATMIREYYSYSNIEVLELSVVGDLVNALQEGVIITPMNGQLLGNIYFTAPGPENHMLVIKGYTEKDREFTTNDPGTRRGNGYRYDENILFDAIRDYPTGHHEPNNKIVRKVILVKK